MEAKGAAMSWDHPEDVLICENCGWPERLGPEERPPTRCRNPKCGEALPVIPFVPEDEAIESAEEDGDPECG
jgi:hypothetical protein